MLYVRFGYVKSPYYSISFDIGCDKCQEWYNGTFVGVCEIVDAEVYIFDR